MKIYLVQHGKAKSEDEDPKRPLSDDGRRETEKIAAHLASAGLKLKKIIHSGKLRAREAAEILGKKLGVEVEEVKNIAPLDDPNHALKYFDNDLMIVGHLPHLSKLAALLLGSGEIIKFNYSGVLCLSKNEKWKVEWYLSPEIC